MRKVWIELERADSFEDAQKNCELVNKVLKKIGVKDVEFFASDEQRYTCSFYNLGLPDGSYYELMENGHWFNLEALANDES